MNGMRGRAAVVAVLAVLVSGCGAEGQSSKAGGEGAPLTLQLGTPDPEGRPGVDQVEEFARQVDARSDGLLRVEPVLEAAGPEQHDWDQAVARMVVDGELDMGMIPARAWDTEGVTSLRALQAPFLVTSDDLVAEIVTGELAEEMLAGLDAAGVTGLALLPEGLRHVFALEAPLLAPADFAGATVRAPRSETAYALFEALGATVDDLPSARFAEAVAANTVSAAESGFAFAGTLPGPLWTATGNLVLYPKVNSLVVNTAALAELTGAQQTTLRAAAEATRTWAIANSLDDADEAEAFCARGGTVATAPDGDLDAFVRAVQPVYADLERDGTTKGLIEGIRQLKQDAAAPAPIAACGPPGAAETEAVAGTGQGGFPEGVYRMEMTAAFLMEGGVDRLTAFDHDGTWTLTFKDGKFLDPGCPNSTYAVEGGRVTIQLGPAGESCGTAAGQVLFSAGWTLQDDQLQFQDVRSGHGSDLLIETLFGGMPLTKIG